MKKDFTRFPQKKDGSFQTKSLGRLYVFSLTLKDQQRLHDELGKTIEDSNPREFIRALIKLVCHTKDKLVEGQFKPNEPSLDDEAIKTLTDNELEAFASLYIQQKEYLFRKWIRKETKGKDGKTVITDELGEINLPKDNDETNVDYLHRLSSNSEKEWRRLVLGMTDFSSKIQNKMLNTISLGTDLKNSLTNLSSFRSHLTTTIEEDAKRLGESIRLREEERIKPFRELAERLDLIIDSSTKAADFLVEMNATQFGIAKELKESSNTAARFSKKNILIGIIIIALTVISLVLGYYSVRQTNQVTGGQNQKMIQGIEDMSSQLETLNRNTGSMMENMSKLIEQQSVLISEIGKARERDVKRIEFLESKLKEVSEKLSELEAKVE